MPVVIVCWVFYNYCLFGQKSFTGQFCENTCCHENLVEAEVVPDAKETGAETPAVERKRHNIYQQNLSQNSL